jgi:HD-GYP domain-containing protein (c-di-GMP phosphodiesterase class II)
MRVVYLPTAPEGTVAGRPIKTAAGTVLVALDKVLTRRDIESLVRRGITHIYARDRNHPDINPTDVVSPDLREIAGNVVRTSIEDMGRASRIGETSLDTSALLKLASDVVDDLAGTRRFMLDMLSMFDTEDYLYNHLVNAAILAVMGGYEYGLTANDLVRLGQGMLLHDIGMTRVPREIYEKKTPLTPAELAIIRAHPRDGSQMALTSGISPMAANLILRHHEAWDGSGYPDGIAGEAIPPLARLAAVAEVYDALTSPRPHASPLLPNEAASWILRAAGRRFEPRSVAAVLAHVAMYPSGIVVELNTGESGLAVKTEPGSPARPIVRVLYDAEGRKLASPTDVDLRQDEERKVTGAYHDFGRLREERLRRLKRAA